MKHLSKAILLVVIGILAFSVNITAQSSQETDNKQYVRIVLENGDIENFEYRSFIQRNFKLQEPAWVPPAAIEQGDDLFMFKRILFKESKNCEVISIGLSNLRELEFAGRIWNECTEKEELVFRVELLDLRKFVGVFQVEDSDVSATMSVPEFKGRILNSDSADTAKEITLPIEKIKRIFFIAR